MVSDGAKVIIYCNGRYLLFHRDNKPNINAPDCWCLVGGGIEVGETPEQGLAREMREEVTYFPNKYLLIENYRGSQGEKVFLYYIEVNQSEVNLFRHNPGEGQEIGWFSIEEIKLMKLTSGLKKLVDSGQLTAGGIDIGAKGAADGIINSNFI